MLKALLTSIDNQYIPSNIKIEVIVVDNDTDQAGKDIVQRLKDNGKHRYYYFVQPEKNIAITRNVAVEKAQGEYLFFIDDDEEASPNWVTTLIDTMLEYGADGVFGRVRPNFHKDAPNWARSCYLFNRPSVPTGSKAISTSTANCVIKSSILKKHKGPFDPDYGISGGEDTRLFTKLRNMGSNFIYCKEGWVSEYIPPERTTMKWATKRALRGGNSYARVLLSSRQKKSFVTVISLSIKANTMIIYSLIMLTVCLPVKSYRIHWILKLVSNFGKNLAIVGTTIKEY